MENSKRVAKSPNACLISLFFSGAPEASVLSNTDTFFTSLLSKQHQTNLYVTSGSISVSEKSKQTRAGLQYVQTVKFTLPSTDELRATRIDQFKRVKFIGVQLTDKSVLFFGRNDIHQNTKPKVSVSSNEKLTAVEYQQTSMFPLSFLVHESFTFQDGMQFIFQDGSSFN